MTLKPKDFSRQFIYLALSGLWALGMAAFFTLPVIFESKFVSLWTLTSGYFNYLAHFADLKQIFLDINWGYGASQLGPVDEMSFAIGYLHWIVPGCLLLATLFSKKLLIQRRLIAVLIGSMLVSLFLMHSKSTTIWQILKPLEFLQFPWRFMTLGIFFASFVSGAIVYLVPIRYSQITISILLLSVLLLNANYFRPREWYPTMTDKIKFEPTSKSWQLQLTSSIFDYLPIYAPLPPAHQATTDLTILQGIGSFERQSKKSNYQRYSLVISEPAIVQLETLYFPGWKLFLDGIEQQVDPSLDPLLGRPQLLVPPGPHILEYKLFNTPIRSISNFVSFVSWLILIWWLVFRQSPLAKWSTHGLK